jgi:hypothetical protein
MKAGTALAKNMPICKTRLIITKVPISRTSLAMRDGYNVAAILTPLRADPKKCEKGETPIACEFRLTTPALPSSVWRPISTDVPPMIMAGTCARSSNIPSSRAWFPSSPPKATTSKATTASTPRLRKSPWNTTSRLWNFWAALQPLPNQGHSTELNDGFHLSFSRNFFDQPKNMLSGWPWRNLTALQALDAVRRGLQESVKSECIE